MGYILPEIYQSLCRDHNVSLPKVFVETGTFMGGIPHRMLEKNGNFYPFEKIYTIEIGEDICKIASKRYKLFEEYAGDMSKFNFHTDEKDESFSGSEYYFDNKLKLICGDSAEMLDNILSEINEPVCFWLDAHAGSLRYARGDEDVPLLKELSVISKHHVTNHIIGIDDSHLFGHKEHDSNGNVVCDYSNITFDKVKNLILDINPNYDVGMYKPYNMEMVLAI